MSTNANGNRAEYNSITLLGQYQSAAMTHRRQLGSQYSLPGQKNTSQANPSLVERTYTKYFLKTNQISAISQKTAFSVVKSSLALTPSLRWSCLKLSATDDGWKDVDFLIFHSSLTLQLHTKTSCLYVEPKPS